MSLLKTQNIPKALLPAAQLIFASGFSWSSWIYYPSYWAVSMPLRWLCSWYARWKRCASSPWQFTTMHVKLYCSWQ